MDSTRSLRLLKSWVELLLIVGVAALLWPSSLLGRVDYVMVSGTSMEPGLHTGDLVLVRPQDGYEAGDAIAYRVPDGQAGAGAVVIHRVIGGNGTDGYVTQGDNRDEADGWLPTNADVLGTRWALVPGAGTLVARVRAPLPLGILAGLLAFAVLAVPPKRRAAVVSP